MSEASAAQTPAASSRDRATAALMALLAEHPLERIGLADVAGRAGLSLAQLRADFPSVLAMVAAFMKDIDRQLLAADVSDMTEEPVREQLFELVMRRLELLAPHKAAVRSLLRSSLRNPPLALLLNGLSARSMAWMLEAAGISAAGPRGALRAQAMTLLYARVLAAWVRDEDPGLARTMAVLDRELARGQQWSGFLDTLLAIPGRLHAARRRARRHRDGKPDDDVIAA